MLTLSNFLTDYFFCKFPQNIIAEGIAAFIQSLEDKLTTLTDLTAINKLRTQIDVLQDLEK